MWSKRASAPRCSAWECLLDGVSGPDLPRAFGDRRTQDGRRQLLEALHPDAELALRSMRPDEWIRADDAEVIADIVDVEEVDRVILGAMVARSAATRLPLAEHLLELARAGTLPVGVQTRSLLRAVVENDEETGHGLAQVLGVDWAW